MGDLVRNAAETWEQPSAADPRDLSTHLEAAARLVWEDVAELLREVETRQASVEELFARLLASMLPLGLRVAPCHVFNRDGLVGPACKLTVYDSRVWAGLPTARGTQLIPTQAVFALVEVDRVLTAGAVTRALELFETTRSLWMPGQEPPLTMLLSLEGASALHIRDLLPAGADCQLDVVGILDRWLIVFQASREENGPLARLGTVQERFPRVDYPGRHTPIVLHQLLHQQLLPEHRGAEHDALRRELARMVTSLLPLYDREYCRKHTDRLSTLTRERMRRSPTHETVLFCSDFLSYLELIDRTIEILPRV
ncbi:MAG: hypothetical protein MUE60_06720 [Candidatus Eisenbacteria bacterium]|jgi:hypothetical protein|nr:hypothetical protein [Candidatus Eisenbacteria bacterium]